MSQLRELANTRQVEGEPKRRWFSSPDLDLIVWLGADEAPIGFQLCYDKDRGERALTWHAGRGFDHAAVDDGDRTGTQGYKGTPILVADGAFEPGRVKAAFLESSAEIPKDIRGFVSKVLDRYPKA